MALSRKIDFGGFNDLQSIYLKKVSDFLNESGSMFVSDLVDWYFLDANDFFDEKCSDISNLLNKYKIELLTANHSKKELGLIGEKCICLVLCGAVLGSVCEEGGQSISRADFDSRGEMYSFIIKNGFSDYRKIRKLVGDIYEWVL